jgi:hypothetical protein
VQAKRRADSGGDRGTPVEYEVSILSTPWDGTYSRYLAGAGCGYCTMDRRRYGRRQREGTPGAMSSTKVSTQAKNKNVRSDRFALMGADRFQRGPDETAPHVAAGEREKRGGAERETSGSGKGGQTTQRRWATALGR